MYSISFKRLANVDFFNLTKSFLKIFRFTPHPVRGKATAVHPPALSLSPLSVSGTERTTSLTLLLSDTKAEKTQKYFNIWKNIFIFAKVVRTKSAAVQRKRQHSFLHSVVVVHLLRQRKLLKSRNQDQWPTL